LAFKAPLLSGGSLRKALTALAFMALVATLTLTARTAKAEYPITVVGLTVKEFRGKTLLDVFNEAGLKEYVYTVRGAKVGVDYLIFLSFIPSLPEGQKYAVITQLRDPDGVIAHWFYLGGSGPTILRVDCYEPYTDDKPGFNRPGTWKVEWFIWSFPFDTATPLTYKYTLIIEVTE